MTRLLRNSIFPARCISRRIWWIRYRAWIFSHSSAWIFFQFASVWHIPLVAPMPRNLFLLLSWLTLHRWDHTYLKWFLSFCRSMWKESTSADKIHVHNNKRIYAGERTKENEMKIIGWTKHIRWIVNINAVPTKTTATNQYRSFPRKPESFPIAPKCFQIVWGVLLSA